MANAGMILSVDALTMQETEGLFSKLPERIFAALASQNRQVYWRVIEYLYEEFFGPDVQAPPVDGYPLKTVQHSIEDVLSHIDGWLPEEDETPDTPLAVRANRLLRKLETDGWLTVTRRGARQYILMGTQVLTLTSALIGFVHAEPMFLSAKVRSIKALLLDVYEGSGDGDQLNEAASQSRQLIEYIRHMIAAITGLDAALRKTNTTAEFVRTFFDRFIETHFIGDYRELRTRDHPLAERARIVDMAEALSCDPDQRERLITWYCERRTRNHQGKAEMLFARDIGRLLDFNRIDEYLLRLDDEIRRVNQRALATLDYRLRSSDRFDRLLNHAVRAVIASDEAVAHSPCPAGDMISPDRLTSPPQPKSAHQPTALRDTVISPEALARAALRREASAARTISAPELAAFVNRQLGDADTLRADQLSLETIKDIRAFQVLSALAPVSLTNSAKLALNARVMARDFEVKATPGADLSTPFLTTIPFNISRKYRRRTKEKTS